MATLVLTRLWINRMDTGEGVSGASNRDKQQTFAKQIEVRQYANGRRRAIGVVGEAAELPFTLVAVTLATKELLRSWQGLNVQVRDVRSQKWYGVFTGLTVREYMPNDLYAVSFTLLTTTTAEGV